MAEKEKNKYNSNPFNKGVSYNDFLKELGKTSIKTFLKDICTSDEIKWIETEIENYKKLKNK